MEKDHALQGNKPKQLTGELRFSARYEQQACVEETAVKISMWQSQANANWITCIYLGMLMYFIMQRIDRHNSAFHPDGASPPSILTSVTHN